MKLQGHMIHVHQLDVQEKYEFSDQSANQSPIFAKASLQVNVLGIWIIVKVLPNSILSGTLSLTILFLLKSPCVLLLWAGLFKYHSSSPLVVH